MPIGGRMAPQKPARVERDEFQSAKWDEICQGRSFTDADVPSLTLLCAWYQVVEQCIDDIMSGGGMQVAYSNDMGDIKALPQLNTMKQASAEIRQLNKQLGIAESGGGEDGTQTSADPLTLLLGGAKRAAV